MLYYDYTLTRTIPSTGAAAGNYFFSANGVFDPDVTGVGHQPLGFDQMMLFFEQYTVISSSITVTFTSDYELRCALFLNPDATSVTEQRAIVENGLAKTVAFAAYTTQTGNFQHQLSLSCDVKNYFGRKTNRELLDDTNLVGTAAANPTEQVYYAVTGWFNTINPGANKNLYFDVALSYDVIFWEPKKARHIITRIICMTMIM